MSEEELLESLSVVLESPSEEPYSDNFNRSKRQRNIDRYIEGVDIALLMYAVGWLSVGIIFTFTTNEVIKYLLEFYRDYDLIAVFFAVIHLNYSTKLHSDENYRFLKFRETNSKTVILGILMVGICIVFLVGFNEVLRQSLQVVMGQVDFINEYDVNTHIILSVFRIIGTEELVFRGFALIVVYIISHKILIYFGASEGEKVSIILAIIIAGTYFGGIHIFRYYEIDPLSGNLSINTVQSIIYLIVLGVLCAILTIKVGLWAAILLHTANNILSLYAGLIIDFGMEFSPFVIVVIGIFVFAIITVYKTLITIRDDLFYFPHFAFSAILAFIIGFYTNSILSREMFGGLYFEHFHWILFAPAIYIIFKHKTDNGKLTNKMNNGKAYSTLIGVCIGLFISDYLDILALSTEELFLTILYITFAVMSYYVLGTIMKANKRRFNI